MLNKSWKLILSWFGFIAIVLSLPLFHFPKFVVENTDLGLIIQEVILLIFIFLANRFLIKQPIFWKTNLTFSKQLVVVWFPVLVFLILLITTIISNKPRFNVVLLSLITVTFVGLVEELFFRGIFLMSSLQSKTAITFKRILLMVLISSIIFGMTHAVNALHQSLLATIIQIISAAMLGILLSAIYLRTGSIFWPILIHALNDSLGFVANGQHAVVSHVLSIGPIDWIALIIGLVLLRRSKLFDKNGKLKLPINNMIK